MTPGKIINFYMMKYFGRKQVGNEFHRFQEKIISDVEFCVLFR